MFYYTQEVHKASQFTLSLEDDVSKNSCWTNLFILSGFEGPVTATITTKGKISGVNSFFVVSVILIAKSDWPLMSHSSYLCQAVTFATSWCVFSGNVTLHQIWLINQHFLHFGIILWRVRDYFAREKAVSRW